MKTAQSSKKAGGKISRTKAARLSQASSSVSKSSRARKAFERHRDVYPVIVFALLPSLTFWSSANVTELTLHLMKRSLIISLLIGLLYYLAFYFALTFKASRDYSRRIARYKASLLSIAAILLTLSYRFFYTYYKDAAIKFLGANSVARGHEYFMPLIGVAFLIFVFLVVKKLHYSKTIRNYVALLASVLLLLNSYPIVRQWFGTYDLNSIEFGTAVPQPSKDVSKQPPDIYYLVFDRYANQQVLKDVYNFDNSPFLNGLKDKGFYVAEDSAANYPATSFSLASSLNLDYLPEKLNDRSENGLFTSILHNGIEDNRTVEFLKDQDYSFINIGPWWNTTKYSKHADQNLYNPTGFIAAGKSVDLQEHELFLMQDSIYWQFTKDTKKLGKNTLIGRTYPAGDTAGRAIHKQTMLHQFATLKEVSKESGPKFVFSHVLLPHDPYVVDENCKAIPKSSEHEYKLYVKQIQCANTKIQATIDYILKNSPTDPIIIVQADEGPYPIEFRRNKNLDWSKASTQLLHQKEKILNAYYFPDKDYEALYPDISPVNSFRIVFNQYFGTELPLLEDRHFFSESKKKRFHIFEVTDKFHD